MIYLNLLLIAIFIVCVVDLTDFPSTIKKVLSFIITRGKFVKDNYRIHFIDCSLCISFWTGLLYLFLTNNVAILSLSVLILITVNTMTIKSIIQLIIDVINILIKKIYERID